MKIGHKNANTIWYLNNNGLTFKKMLRPKQVWWFKKE